MPGRTWQAVVAAQLLLSYLIASTLATGTALILVNMGFKLALVLLAATAVGGTVGLALTLNIQHSLYVLELVLSQLAQDIQVKRLSAHRHWPLTALFEQVQALEQHMAEQESSARLTTEQRNQLLRQVSEAAALEERNRLARELHDSIKQQLFSISMSAAAIRARRGESLQSASESLDDIVRSAQEAQVEMQALLQQLRPAALDMAGLVEALRTQCQAIGYRTDAQITVEIGNLPSEDCVPPGTQEALFRIAQEALANIARHTRARNVSLSLYRQDNDLLIEIHDDGQGFDPATAHAGMGLVNMRERAQAMGGSVEIESRVGHGTTLTVHMPLIDTALLRQAQEQREREIEVQRVTGRFERAKEIGMLAIQVTGVLILLGAPFLIVGLCLCASVYEYLAANRFKTHVSLIAGRNSRQMLALRCQQQELLASILLLAGLCSWYLPVVAHMWSVQIAGWIATGLSAVGVTLVLFTLVQFYRNQHSYYSLLNRQERDSEIKHSQNTDLANLGVWLVVVILAFFIGGFSPGFPAHSFDQWSSDATLALLILWPTLALIDLLWLALQKQAPLRMEDNS
ncbi:MAG TPA: sensor histidine kinase [Ktedonobacteraceae bacterium]|nr:sensor histidine kinase [Ktedonobacteraceae bacterium]